MYLGTNFSKIVLYITYMYVSALQSDSHAVSALQSDSHALCCVSERRCASRKLYCATPIKWFAGYALLPVLDQIQDIVDS